MSAAFKQEPVLPDPATAPGGRRRGRFAWHLRRPAQGPRSLAIKNHFVAMVGEYVGTTLFLLFALGIANVANIPTTSVTGETQAGQDGSQASVANTSNLLYIALGFGFSLAVTAWTFFRISGGLFNPAVSFGMMLIGAITPIRAALLTVSQILGGITGAAIVHALLPGTLNVRTLLAPGVSIARGLFIEMFLTALLMLAILLLAAEKSKATFLAPIGIGLALFVAELMGVYYTGGSLNPARSFGPAVVLREFSGYHWIYWLGPILGSTLAAGFYKFIKFLEYETVLGPEDPVPQLQAPPTALLGTVNATTAGEKTSTSTATPAAAAAAAEPETGTADVQGPGIGDLLTDGSPHAVFALPPQPQPPVTGEYVERLERIEAMLAQLVQGREATTPVVGGQKVSMEGTLVEEPHGHGKWKRDSPV
ncbi:hypothetical protein JCM8097_001041 [Rhodosporidiobolus ruineniae]